MATEVVVGFIVQGLFAVVLFMMRGSSVDARDRATSAEKKVEDIDKRVQALEVKLAGEYLNKKEFFAELERLRDELVQIRNLLINDLKSKGD